MSLISIIIPVYNAELYIKKCLKSVISQTLNNIEIVCVDDGSTDGSVRICNKNKNIIFISQENRGLLGMVNFGIAVLKSINVNFGLAWYLIKKM